MLAKHDVPLLSISAPLNINQEPEGVIEQQQWFRLSVTDNGLGIDGDLLPNLFQSFRQVHTGAARKFGGQVQSFLFKLTNRFRTRARNFEAPVWCAVVSSVS